MSGVLHNPFGQSRRMVTVTQQVTPDPYIHTGPNGIFYLTFTAGDHVEIWTSNNPVDFKHPGVKKTVIWRPERGSPFSDGVWAPELHSISGRWYVYVAASHPGQGNRSHRMIVLGGPPADQDPTSGHWELYGPIKNLPTEQWSIDGTVFWINNVLYFVYSGWPLDGRPESEKTQQLFIARLQDPLTASSSPVLISDPSNPWERSGDAGINEGPQWLADPNGSFIGIVYSCAGSWTRDYKLGVLQYEGGDPLNPHSWKKWHKPLLQSGDNAHCHGPGHCSFVPYNHEMLVIFHATDNPTDGWGNRKARAQVLNFHNGLPDMGGFVGAMCDSLHGAEAVPSGPGGPGPSGAPTKGEEPHGLKKLEGKIKDMIKEPIKEITDELHHKRK